MNMEEQLRDVVTRSTTDSNLWHRIVHGNAMTEVETENGFVPSIAKQLKDARDAVMGGAVDVINAAREACDDAIAAKNQADAIKCQTQDICDVAADFRNEAEGFKNQSQAAFDNIVSATDAAVLLVENTGNAQVARVQNAGTDQVAIVAETGAEQTNNAKAAADRALYYAQCATPAPLASKLTVPACAKVPVGYEPTWYKNIITRARYPDFFTQLVDTESLFFVDEATYDDMVAEFDMCNAYVKVDNDTLILPLLLHYGRGGTPEQIGQVQHDQFQGHFHQYKQGASSGNGTNTKISSETNSANPSGTGASYTGVYLTDGVNGTPRVGDETHPKSYFELTYIKCADVTRPLAVEETGEIRNLLTGKLDVNLNNLLLSALNDKLFETIVEENSWYQKNLVTGLVIQGGKFNIATNALATIPYVKKFSSPPLTLNVNPYNQPTSHTTDTNYLTVPVNIAAENFQVRYYDSESTSWRQGWVSWMAVGF